MADDLDGLIKRLLAAKARADRLEKALRTIQDIYLHGDLDEERTLKAIMTVARGALGESHG